MGERRGPKPEDSPQIQQINPESKVKQMNPDSGDAHPTMAFDAIEVREQIQRETEKRGGGPSVVLSPEIAADADREFGDTILGMGPIPREELPVRQKVDSAQKFQVPPRRLLQREPQLTFFEKLKKFFRSK